MRITTRMRGTAALLCSLAVITAGITAGPATAGPANDGQAVSGATPSVTPPKPPSIPDLTTIAPSSADWAMWQRRLAATSVSDASAGVIVTLRVRSATTDTLDAAGRAAQTARIAAAQQAVLAALRGTPHVVYRQFKHVPSLALQLSPSALGALRGTGLVAQLSPDELMSPTLDDSEEIVESRETHLLGRTGLGRRVAILDTGVEKSHPFFGGRVVREFCYSDGDCPNGLSFDFAPGSGKPCTYSTKCDHGTHVAGIAAGNGSTFDGVASNANIVAAQVFSAYLCSGTPCPKSRSSDQMAAMELVLDDNNDGNNYASVNMSLGGSTKYTGYCDGTDFSYAATVANLKNAGIAVVIASGNDSFTNGISSPACFSAAYAIGNTTKSDTVSSSSNSSNLVALLAPGTSITSSGLNGSFVSKSGTSMAAPHVAGAFAVLEPAYPSETTADLMSRMQASGRPITDSKNGITKPRLRLLTAMMRTRDTGFSTTYSVLTNQGGVLSYGRGFASRVGAATNNTFAVTIPSGTFVKKAYLFWQTIGQADDKVIFDGTTYTGSIAGASRNACENVNSFGLQRTYRLDVTSKVTHTANYTLSSVGAAPGDGEGASLVIVYDRSTTTSQKTRVIIRSGALTAGEDSSMSHSFVVSVPVTPLSVNVRVGVGNGETFADRPMLFRSAAITSTSPFQGTDGKYWDDNSYFPSTSLLPAGTTSASNTIQTDQDCLAWSWAALAYRYQP